MLKEKKEFDKNHAAHPKPDTLLQGAKEKSPASHQAESQYTFSRYAFDSAGGGYQGL